MVESEKEIVHNKQVSNIYKMWPVTCINHYKGQPINIAAQRLNSRHLGGNSVSVINPYGLYWD